MKRASRHPSPRFRRITTKALAGGAVAALAAASTVSAQSTTTNGSALALRSSGTVVGSGVRLQQNGYLGTYVTLPSPGSISLSVNAVGQLGGGVAPHMNVVVGDQRFGFDIGASTANYSTGSIALPAGTHFIRTEFTNDISTVDRRLTINSLQVNGPATLANGNSDANALAAANTYIANHRKGDANVTLFGAAPGTPVQVRLVDHAFKFGTAVPGTTTSSVNTFLANNPAPGSVASNFQQRLLANFNSVTPENAGKWVNNQATQAGATSMGGVDRISQFAQANDLRVRAHNLIWGQQQPNYVNDLLTDAAGGDVAARNELSAEITKRIGYYVRDRAPTGYAQLDVLNESVHEPAYWNVYGPSGVASIYNETRDAVANPAQRPVLFTNEYNVIQDSSDTFANWYRQNVEAIRQAGGDVGGIGVQYYPHNAVGSANNQHSAARMFGVLQNLAVAGLPIELTEVGVKPDGAGTTAEIQQRAAQILESSLRLAFGSPDVSGFTMWGIWAGSVWSGAPDGVLYNNDWSARPAGAMWEDLMSIDADGVDDDWNTYLSLVVGPDGTIDFNGFYGEYELAIGSETYLFELAKGTTDYTIPVPEPVSIIVALILPSTLSRRERPWRS